jgi:hypothetical protein
MKAQCKNAGMRECRAVSLAFLHFCILAFSIHAAPSAQEVALADVLSRAGAYVVEFQKQLAGIVAEEQYSQQTSNRSMSTFRSTAQRPSARELKSDLLLLKPEGSDRWIQFRDVFEVDGKPVRDRDGRLIKLFLQPSSTTATQAENIIAESTRYNIGNLQRTVNVPVLALSILDPATQRRFQFSRTRDDKPKLAATPASGTFWAIEYKEVSAGTIIRTTNGRDMPCRGRFWIEPATGRVLLSELTAEDTALRAVIDVTYQPDPALGLLVPSVMRERYDIRGDGSRVDGRATYGKFRQFQVKVDEKIAPVKEKQ